MKEIKKRLDSVSPSFCLAKWTQVNLYLHAGLTHSCHHPVVHKIPTESLKDNPSSLHNTPHKIEMRQLMLKGERPSECEYCWNMEDLGQPSDRLWKSSTSWSAPHFDKVLQSQHGETVLPTYMEVAFESVCNFKCSYCTPTHSTSWAQEIKHHGPYPTKNQYHHLDPAALENSADNPYVEAFWKWWPELSKSLHTFRITGGEPLLSRHTWKFLDRLIEAPCPDLEISINSNLGLPPSPIRSLIEKINQLEGKVKGITLFVSMDTHGAQAEYIRHGLNYAQFMSNAETILSEVRVPLRFSYMVTASALSLPGLKAFYETVAHQKRAHERHEIFAEASYLRYPSFMSVLILPRHCVSYVEDTLKWIEEQGSLFTDHEKSLLQNLSAWMRQPALDESRLQADRADFYRMFHEHDRRRQTDFEKTFPEFREFWRECQSLGE